MAVTLGDLVSDICAKERALRLKLGLKNTLKIDLGIAYILIFLYKCESYCLDEVIIHSCYLFITVSNFRAEKLEHKYLTIFKGK